jgi:hypothetical protein
MENIDRQIGFDVGQAQQQFAAANALASGIEEQNNRFTRIEGEIDDTDFRELAIEGLAAEQQTTVNSLSEQVSDAPYEQFAQTYLEIEDRLGALVVDMALHVDNAETAGKHFDELVELVTQLSPFSAEKARELAEQKKQETRTRELEELKSEHTELSEKLQEFNELYATIGKPWQVPLARNRDIVVDEIPVEPVVTEHSVDRLKGYQQRFRTEGASSAIAFYLSEKSGEVVTPQEITEFLYDDEVKKLIPSNDCRKSVMTMLGPKIQGKRIQAMLAEDNLVLQYGWRVKKRLNQRGRYVVNDKKRIYRAIPADQLADKHFKVKRYNSSEIRWDVTSEQQEIAAKNKQQSQESEQPANRRRVELQNARDAMVDLLLAFQDEPLTLEDIADVLYSDSEALSSKLKKRVSAILSKGRAYIEEKLQESGAELIETEKDVEGRAYKAFLAKSLTPKEVDSKEGSLQNLEDGQQIEVRKKGGLIPHEREKEFRTAAKDAVQGLAQADLLMEGKVSRKILSAKTASRIMGTKTAMNRLHAAGLISNEDLRDELIGTKEAVMMCLFNTNRDVLGKGPRQKYAIAIIEGEITKALKEQKSK